ncbi:hypothetical protein [Kitasatospora sp. NPDC094016]|uniref:hypothetical protein n=1 Tax=Kitasatospora sp. NPDC094016 TaxID=3154986 RepID=UPI0033315669
MTGPLLVPVEVEALLVNDHVRNNEPFQRWQADFYNNLDDHHDPEPAPFESVDDFASDPSNNGVYLQWQLPQALRSGYLDPVSSATVFPLVPNRWLVTRSLRLPGQGDAAPEVTGWIVDGDFNDQGSGDGTAPYLDPTATAPAPAWIGRSWDLAQGPWQEPSGRTMFLTAVGCGLASFSTYQPYNENVLSFHDLLDGVPEQAELSYSVIGWYSDQDILAAGDLQARLAELGWSADQSLTAVSRSLYTGQALGLSWDNRADANPPDSDRPADFTVDAAIGHTTADAMSALPTTDDPAEHQLWTALQYGLLDELDVSQAAFDQATHAAWFGPAPPQYQWAITDRAPGPGGSAVPADESWLAQLNADQRDYDTKLGQLTELQKRLYGLWWLAGLPDNETTPDFRTGYPALRDDLAQKIAALQGEVAGLSAQLPSGSTRDALQQSIAAYAAAHGIVDNRELKRTVCPPFFHTPDPAIVLRNTGNSRRITRDTDLPCRTPGQLVTTVTIAGTPVTAPADPPTPDLTGLPETAALTALLAEHYLLGRAAASPATDQDQYVSALAEDLTDPAHLIVGTVAEFTESWRQPWMPLYLVWEIGIHRLPYRTGTSAGDATDNWAFDGTRYRWQGTDPAPQPATVRGRSILTALPPFNAAARLAQHASRHPDAPAAVNRLREAVAGLDLVSQTLDGINNWFLQRRSSIRLPAGDDVAVLAGSPRTPVPAPGDPDQVDAHFQPVRAGQFFLRNVMLVDNFGRACAVTTTQDQQFEQCRPYKAVSVTPDDGKIAADTPPACCFTELPPRLLQPARLDFTLAPETRAVCGWLLATHLNRADRALLVYGEDGAALGELRFVITPDHDRAVAWHPLPGSAHPDLDDPDFAAAYPELTAFLKALRDRGAPAFTSLLDVLDDVLSTRAAPAGVHTEHSLTELAGRPLALLRARLRFELSSGLLACGSWDRILSPATRDYLQDPWNIRLGDPDLPTDGLVGFFTGDDYGVLHTHGNPPQPDPYLNPITGAELRLPTSLAGDDESAENSARITLIADPWLAVHAITDILPSTALQLPDDTVRTALSRLRVAFRMDSLPASEQADRLVMPTPAAWQGTWSWSQRSRPAAGDAREADAPGWDTFPLTAASSAARLPHPTPAARSGYLQLADDLTDRQRSQS